MTGSDPGKQAEHARFMDLVKDGEVTHRAVRDGAWTDPGTWEGGRIPGDGDVALVPKGVTVRFDAAGTGEIAKLRVDGTLDFATDRDTRLDIGTMTVTEAGTLEIGTAGDPVGAGHTAEIVFFDQGAIGYAEGDPAQLRHGLISHGAVEIHGAAKTGHLAVAVDAAAGDRRLVLAEAPDGWRPGDRLALTGTELLNGEPGGWGGTEDEVVTIDRIEGDVVHLREALRFDHATPGDEGGAGDGRDAFVGNLTRNVVIRSERTDPGQEPDVSHRGHVMFMHSDEVHVAHAAFLDLGRTDKGRDLDDVRPGMVPNPPETIDNIRGRYALHVHRVGEGDGDGRTPTVEGSVVWGSPGWGMVSHDSRADFLDNVSYDVFGAHYVAETGNETGRWEGNIAIKSEGRLRDKDIGFYMGIHDFAQDGVGFWLNGRQVEVVDNVAAGMRAAGFGWLNRGDGMIGTPTGQLEFPLLALYGDSVESYNVPIRHVVGNQTFASTSGLEVMRRGLQQGHDVRTHIEGFDAWDVGTGMRLDYTTNYTVEGVTLLGDQSYRNTRGSNDTTGVVFAKNVENMALVDWRIEGFETGIKVQNNFVVDEVDRRGNGIWWEHDLLFVDVRIAGALVEKAANQVVGMVVDKVVRPTVPMPEGWTPQDVFEDWVMGADLTPGRLRLDLDDSSLGVRWGPDAATRYLRLTGTKTDSFGAVDFPVANERIEVNHEGLLNALERIGIWRLLDGTYVTRLEVAYSDRVTAEVATQAFVAAFPAGWTPTAAAKFNGPAVPFDAGTYVPAALRGPARFATARTDPDGGVTFLGTAGADVMEGGDGRADRFEGGEGNDLLLGAGGDDRLRGGAGADVLDGDAGADALDGDAGDDALDGGTGDDALRGGTEGDRLWGGVGRDRLDGDAGDDALWGGTEDDALLGGDGADRLHGESGMDRLEGGTGDDALDGGTGDDALFGGDGVDTALGGDSRDLLDGGAGDDALDGGEAGDTLDGGEGEDTLLGGAGSGADTLRGGAGLDALDGGGGNDLLYGGADADALRGGEGTDGAYGDAGDDLLEGELGNDRLYGGEGVDALRGGEGNDKAYGEAGNDDLDGGLGDDTLDGGDGLDALLGGDGLDALLGGGDGDRLHGGEGADRLDGGLGDDLLLGDAGNDRLSGGDGEGADRLEGGTGDDSLSGGGGRDILLGGEGLDTLVGGDGDDALEGGPGGDLLQGGNGLDRLAGGAGQDRLQGQAGIDTFVATGLGEADADLVLDYARDERLDLSDLLGAFDPGTGSINAFVRKTLVGEVVKLAIDIDGAVGPAGFQLALTVDPAGTGYQGLDAGVADLSARGILVA